jgi:protein-S-isoprenylcysteine O-methyltransferase
MLQVQGFSGKKKSYVLLIYVYLLKLIKIQQILTHKTNPIPFIHFFQIAIRAAFLGYLFGISLFIIFTMNEKYKSFGIYLAFLTVFHYSEYLIISITHPQSLSLDSFMLNHSIQYGLAALISWAEFFVEVYYYPEMKKYKILWLAGALVCFSGEILRKTAMITAQKSFHHLVQFQQNDDHKLVKSGVYGIMRHPSYVGWFYWSIGTQIILANPLCTILYTIASWLFFRERIHMEEITLLNFFGQEYFLYQQNTATGLPFIEGYIVTES